MSTSLGRAVVTLGVDLLIAACGGATPADRAPALGGPATTDGAAATPEGGEATPKPLTVKVTKLLVRQRRLEIEG